MGPCQRSGIEPLPTAHDAGEGKRLVTVGKHRAGQFVAPGGDGWLSRSTQASNASTADRTGHLCPAVLQDFRAPDEHLRAGRGFVADHLRRTRPAACRPHALTINPCGDYDALAGLQHLGSLADGAERPRAAARTVVVSGGSTGIDVVHLRERQGLFPCGVRGAVGQARIPRRGASRRLRGTGWHLIPPTGGNVSSETRHCPDTCRVSRKARRSICFCRDVIAIPPDEVATLGDTLTPRRCSEARAHVRGCALMAANEAGGALSIRSSA